MAQTNPTETTTRSWWKHPFTWVAVIVVLVAVVAAVGYFSNPDDAAPTPAAPPPAVNKPTVPSGSAGDYLGNDVDVTGRGMRIPVNPNGHVLAQDAKTSSPQLSSPIAAPAGLEWQKVYGVPVPFSTSDGPSAITDAGVPSGFSRTPQGAALAGLQIMFRAVYGPQPVRTAVLADSIVGTDDLKDRVLKGQNPAQYQTIPAALQITPDHYTRDAATVRWAFGPFPAPDTFPTTTGTYYTTLDVPVVWSADGWKVRLTENLLSTEDGGIEAIDEAGWSTWF